MRHTMIPCLALLLLTACHPETAMNQERAAAEADVAQGGRGLAKLNPSPRKAYELVLRLKDAPGDFAVVEGVAQYDVSNEDQCGHIEPATGTGWRTIMAYNCTRSCPRLNYWSNPNISYNSIPMGNASTADNQRVLVNTKHTIAAFR